MFGIIKSIVTVDEGLSDLRRDNEVWFRMSETAAAGQSSWLDQTLPAPSDPCEPPQFHGLWSSDGGPF